MFFEEDNATFHASNINYVSKQMIKIIRVKIKMIYVYRFFNIELFKATPHRKVSMIQPDMI